MAGAISTHLDGRVLHVRLTRPERGNTFDLESAGEFAKALQAVGPGVGALAVTAEGRNFCLGGDVGGFDAAPDPEAYLLDLAHAAHECVLGLHEAGVPVVIGAPGWSAGAGMALLLAADVVVLGASSRLRAAYPAIGLTPDCGMTFSLPRAVGPGRAREIILTNRPVAATEALTLGIASRVVEDDAVDATVAEIAGALAAGATGALRDCRGLLNESTHRGFADHLEAEARSIARHAASAEGREGIRAFLDKRAPEFPRD